MKQTQQFERSIDPSQYQNFIGLTVRKLSNKPFKSGDKIGTVKAIKEHSITGYTAFIMLEDGSEVEAFRCVKLDS